MRECGIWRLTRRTRENGACPYLPGYVALYRFLPQRDEIRVLALRRQRELDYP